MHRATASNALNIATKIDAPDMYPLEDFVNNIVSYVSTLLESGKIDKIKAYKLIVASDRCLKAYKSDYRYNKTMIIDNYIIDMWIALTGDKT